MSGPFGLGRKLASSRQRIDAGQRSASGKSLGRVVGIPSLWPRPGGVLQQHGLGVLRPSGGANAVAGCWPTGQLCAYNGWSVAGGL